MHVFGHIEAIIFENEKGSDTSLEMLVIMAMTIYLTAFSV